MSTSDFGKHKLDVFDQIKKRYGEKASKLFIKYYSTIYDSHDRSFIDYKLAFWLLDDYYYVRDIGTRFYACVGIGGTGKTTLLKNVFYYLDPTFKPTERLIFNAYSFIKILDKLDTLNSMKAVLMDEPDDSIYVSSKLGKALRDILGKGRQQKLFVGICATDMKDIPPYIYRKLHGVFFLPYLGSYFFFKDRPKVGSYVLQELRDRYTKEGYKVFYRMKENKGCLKGHSIKATPFETTEETKYIKNKADDYDSSIKRFLQMNKESPIVEQISPRDKVIVNMRKKGMKHSEIAELVGLDRSTVSHILVDVSKWGININ